MNPFLAGAVALLIIVAAFLLVSLGVWWLVPLAFPALAGSFGFTNAMALVLLSLLLGAPAMASN